MGFELSCFCDIFTKNYDVLSLKLYSEISSEQAYELYVVSGRNKREALRAFKRIHPGRRVADYPSLNFFVHNYKKMKEHKTVKNVVSKFLLSTNFLPFLLNDHP